MKTMKSVLPKAGMIFLIFTLLCGVIYTGVVTGIAQLIFPDNANGSIIEVDGKKYGCELLGQQYTDEAHMWGRIMNIDVSTYTDENGKALMYAAPSNLSPASEEYAQLVAERVEKLRAAVSSMSGSAARSFSTRSATSCAYSSLAGERLEGAAYISAFPFSSV